MVTVLDASSDPAVMPGDFMSMDPGTGTMAPIESFGAMAVEFMDANDQPLNLDSGGTATIKIPLAERRDPGTAPPSMPLYYWSDSMSSWVEEGVAILQQDAGGQWAYVGSIGHFSTWNADVPYGTVIIEGCVIDNDRDAGCLCPGDRHWKRLHRELQRHNRPGWTVRGSRPARFGSAHFRHIGFAQ